MKKLVSVKIGKKECHLNFSLNVLEKVTENYGSMEAVFGELKEESTADNIRTMIMLANVMAWMSEEGAKYKEYIDGAVGVEFVTADEAKTIIGLEFAEYIEPVTRAITLGQQTEIKTKSKAKNTKAAQGK